MGHCKCALGTQAAEAIVTGNQGDRNYSSSQFRLPRSYSVGCNTRRLRLVDTCTEYERIFRQILRCSFPFSLLLLRVCCGPSGAAAALYHSTKRESNKDICLYSGLGDFSVQPLRHLGSVQFGF